MGETHCGIAKKNTKTTLSTTKTQKTRKKNHNGWKSHEGNTTTEEIQHQITQTQPTKTKPFLFSLSFFSPFLLFSM